MSWRAANPNLLLANGQHRGYLRIAVSHDRLDACTHRAAIRKRKPTPVRACFKNSSSKRNDPVPSKRNLAQQKRHTFSE